MGAIGEAAPVAAPALHGVRKGDFRPDIEGMRAIAVLLVVLYHAGVAWLPGGFIGVDVFFVLSGFLITRLLVAEVSREGRIFLPDFWARRARRLLPASTLTLVVVGIVTWLVVDPGTQLQTGRDIIAAAAFVANWWFAAQATDYFAADVEQSPVQHFWSLSVEEQYYVFWPPALALVIWLLSRGANSRRAVAWAGLLLAGAGAVSFAYSVWMTSAEPVVGYYSTVGRAWELAVGGVLAIAVALGARLAAGPAMLLGYAGFITVMLASVRITEATPFPGTAALAPVLGTAAMILAGTGHVTGAHLGRWLGQRPLTEIGRLSYSWYLWHWPFLILAPYVIGDLDGPRTLAVVIASLIAAELSYRFVENPLRRSRTLARRTRNSLLLGAGLIGTGLVVGMVLTRVAGSVDTGISPEPALAGRDLTQAHADGCLVPFKATTSPECTYGDPESARTLVLLGDSHSVQWFPAVEHAAQELGMRVIVLGKSGCGPFGVDLWSRRLGRAYPECTQWQEHVASRLAALPAGTVVMLSAQHSYAALGPDGQPLDAAASEALLAEGYARTVAGLTEEGKVVVPLRDTPRFEDGNPSRCVAENLEDPASCDLARPEASRGTSWEESSLVAAGLEVPVLDMNDEICGLEVCPVVVDDILRWRDDDHMTNTFATTLGPELARRLRALT